MQTPFNTSGADTNNLMQAGRTRRRQPAVRTTKPAKPTRRPATHAHPAAPKPKPVVRAARVPTLVAKKQAAELKRKNKLRVSHGRSGAGSMNIDPNHKPADLSQPARFHVAITTYNRPELLVNLLNQIRAQTGKHDVRIHVYDDASPVQPSSESLQGVRYTRFERNGGKALFWRSVSRALADAQANDFDYFVMLQDDLELVPNFFDQLRWVWDNVPDRNKAALNIRLDKERTGKPCWTGFKPKIRRFGRLRIWQTQWTDCCFAGSRELVRLIPSIEPISARRVREMTSSGVGRQISIRLHQMGRTVWQASSTLTHHGRHESVMHPELRKRQPLTA